MGYTNTSTSGHTAYDYREYFIDDDVDVDELPTEVLPGSIAFSIATSNLFVLNSKRQWVKI